MQLLPRTAAPGHILASQTHPWTTAPRDYFLLSKDRYDFSQHIASIFLSTAWVFGNTRRWV